MSKFNIVERAPIQLVVVSQQKAKADAISEDAIALAVTQLAAALAKSINHAAMHEPKAAVHIVVTDTVVIKVKEVAVQQAEITFMPVNKPVYAERAQEMQGAAGKLAAYMRSHDMKALDITQLYALSINNNGHVPKDVQKAATFMLSHPEAFEVIDKGDRSGVDGIAGLKSLEKAAQGEKLPVVVITPLMISLGLPIQVAVEKSSLADRAELAAGTLGAFMHEHHMKKVTPDQLYALATNKGGDVPKGVQKAAEFMLGHPEIFKAIDGAGGTRIDGIAGAESFDKAAQGLIDLTGRPKDVAPSLESLFKAIQAALEGINEIQNGLVDLESPTELHTMELIGVQRHGPVKVEAISVDLLKTEKTLEVDLLSDNQIA